MLKINRKVEYGLVALQHMLTKPPAQLTSVREICDRYGTPFDPLAHVMRILSTAKLVESEQGAHGGYRLVADLSRFSVAEFIELIDGQLALTECIKSEEECRCALLDRCKIVSPMHYFHEHMMRFLRSMSVLELLDHPTAAAPAAAKSLSATA
jgi:Rrf2 family protein